VPTLIQIPGDVSERSFYPLDPWLPVLSRIYANWPTLSASRDLRKVLHHYLESDPIIRCVYQILLRTEVPFGGLHRCVPEQQLDLLPLAAAGGELEQIQLLLGHASVQTTERYLGTRQDLVHAPNDGIKLRVAV
jgi:integrase